MGYVPQEGGLLEFLTVTQTLELFHGLHSIRSHQEEMRTSHTAGCWPVLPDMTKQTVDQVGRNTPLRVHSHGNSDYDNARNRNDEDPYCAISDNLVAENHCAIEMDSTPLPLTPPTDTDSHPWGDLIGSTLKSILPSKYSNYRVHTLSGGNRKKLSVAISNINDPAFLAMDECTSG